MRCSRNCSLTDEPLPGAAARLCGNSSRPRSRLAALHADLAKPTPCNYQFPCQTVPPDGRRQLWEHFGVICDDLSAPVLTLNLGIGGPSWLSRLVAEAAGEAQRLHLTSRMIATRDWSGISLPRLTSLSARIPPSFPSPLHGWAEIARP